MRLLFSVIFLCLAVPALAANDRLVKIGTRPGVSVPCYYMKREGAKATVLLLTGGSGGIAVKDGVPTSNNFLVRSRDLFAANGFNVVVVGKPSDHDDLDGTFRTSPEHAEDLRRVIAFVKSDAGAPVWVVGTSMGTISAAALATVAGKDEVSGIVLTSSVTRKKVGALPQQKLESVKQPVLVVHHQSDECKICVPGDVPQIIQQLKNAPIKKELYISGGSTPTGDPCQALHRHGFIGAEKEVVDLISDWIKNPKP